MAVHDAQASVLAISRGASDNDLMLAKFDGLDYDRGHNSL
jgi:hypothetical protein